MARVFVGMSGGVDSSAAALLLRRQGHSVEGIHLRLLEGLPLPEGSASPAAEDARAVAEKLGVPIHFLDLSKEFRESVAADFIAEYQAGRTPNPCVVCNRRIKFGAMLDAALALGGSILPPGTTPGSAMTRPPAAGFCSGARTRPGTRATSSTA